MPMCLLLLDPLAGSRRPHFLIKLMIVPVPEIDSSMECTVLNPGECLVKYFEDNKYSVVPFSDLQHFKPTTIPFLEFELAAGQKFLKNGGVINAMSYIESGKVKRRFSWNRWGSAQDQDLNLDMQRSKAINLPLISDEEYLGSQPQSQAGIHSQSSSAASSPAISTKDDTDIESGSNDPLITQSQAVSGPLSGSSLSMPLTPSSSASSSLAPSVNTTTTAAATAAAGSALKNGMQRPVAGRGVSSQQQQTSSVGNTTLLPSPVSLQDLATAEPMDEIELDARSTKSKTEGTATKDSPTVGRSRSRRGTAADKKENSKRSRNASEQPSSSPSTSSSGSSSGSHAGTTTSTEPGVTSGSGEGIKKRKTGTEPSISTDSQSTAQESNVVSIRSSRQGSAEPSTSPRSTRHSSRHSKAPENNQQAGQGEPRPESPVEPTVSTRLPTHRMTRQRSMPKSANSLPPPAPATTVQATSSEAEQTSNMTDVKEGEAPITEETTKKEDADGTKPMTGVVTAEEESTAMDVDEPELKSTRNQGRGREKSASMPPSSLVSTTASSVTSSPASMGPDDGQMASSASTTSSTTSTNGRLQSLVLDRQEVDRGFAIVLPTLAIGSKEREAFYENIMDHMQKLRQEHRRLKEVLKSSEYVPKGRRATRSSPQYHAHHHHHRHHHHRRQSPAEEKQSHRNESPTLSKSSSANTPNPNNGNSSSSSSNSNKENQSTQSSKASAAAASAAAAKAEAAAAKAEAVSATGAPTFYQGSTPSSAILTSNISTTTRRSAATAAAAAVTATVSRASRQSHHSSGSNGSNGDKEPKRRGGAAASAAANAAAAAAAAAITGDSGSITTRAKRRLR
ncbi:hypothetical protein BGZ97_003583 [Linnemannia gamsii]|uniref:Uncharacterized protein n=1 Tax=Linnemannia gamsii TaxID=64522 RepID=A0A9P6QWY3_9FUNG|nr:hypothetical protein BGZ97_003583 [Linnemannia gamsii]